MTREAVVLFSGGTDSTAAVTLVAPQFDRVHLLTCKHSGLHNIENSGTNVPKLVEALGDKFVHRVVEMDPLFRLVARVDYLRSVRRHGMLLLANCGLCKLAMHLSALLYCLEHEVRWVADGANVHMDVFPAQMAPVIELLKGMYGRFGVTYFNPVFELDYPDDADWTHKLGLHELAGAAVAGDGAAEDAPLTAGRLLHRMGLLPEENVKGSELDRTMQARCFQLFLFNVVVQWYYLPKIGKTAYQERTVAFYRERIALFSEMVQQYLDHPEQSPLRDRVQLRRPRPDRPQGENDE